MRLVLGTANFGLKYGTENKKLKLIDLKKINRLFKYRKLIFDSAIDYKNSHKIIGKNFKKKKVITKIRLSNYKNEKDQENFSKKLIKALNDLRIKKFYAILYHDVNDFLKNKKSLSLLKNLKKNGLVEKIGVSVYSPDDTKKVIKHWNPDILQFPINIYDQRMLEKGFLNKLRKKNIILMARSCFLQGVLLKEQSFFRNKFFFDNHKKFVSWCKKKNLTQLDACISFIRSIKNINLLTFGFDDAKQLNEILLSSKKRVKISFSEFKMFSISKKLNFIDPRLWKKNERYLFKPDIHPQGIQEKF